MTMQQQNQNRSPVNDILTLVMMAVSAILLSVFFVVAFAAFLLSLIALCALITPLELGPVRVDRQRAWAFLSRGMVGGGALMSFVSFAAMIFGFPLYAETLWVAVITGYSLGSVGIEALAMFVAMKAGTTNAGAAQDEAEPAQVSQAIAPKREPVTIELGPRPPFDYATWDDEERRG